MSHHCGCFCFNRGVGVVRHWRLFLTVVCFMICHSTTTLALSTPSSVRRPVVAVVGGGISGLVVGHVLHQSGRYSVELLEANPTTVGGNVRTIPDPFVKDNMLNIGHATHLGMFLNLRLMLRHLGVEEWPVGRGPNDKAGIFRMLSVTTTNGSTCRPPLCDVTSFAIWWEAFVFYYYSYLQPERRLDDFLQQHKFSNRFVGIVYWAMATFEFDKTKQEAGEYALGAARALLITQVFFHYLLCDAFEGCLPRKVDQGLAKELASRIDQHAPVHMRTNLKDRLDELEPIGSYFSANYKDATEKLARGAGNVRTNAVVERITKKNNRIVVETERGDTIQVDKVVFTLQPSLIAEILDKKDFAAHVGALQQVESGAVGVRIVHAKELPFCYPPTASESAEPEHPLSMKSPAPILGIFDISELTTKTNNGQQSLLNNGDCDNQAAGWLSVAYPVYQPSDNALNRHDRWLSKFPCADETVYPWIRATSTFPEIRKRLVALQGKNDIYITGHTLTGVNKASELQMTNALNLCYNYFGVTPPWTDFFPTPSLPDCNDDDAFFKASSTFQAMRLAFKSLIGSFLLTGVVARFGKSFFT